MAHLDGSQCIDNIIWIFRSSEDWTKVSEDYYYVTSGTNDIFNKIYLGHFQDLNYKWLQSKKKKPWINLFWLKHFFYIRRFIPLNAFTLQKNVYCLWKFLSLILIYRYCLIHRYCLISLFRNWKLCIHTFKYWCWLYSC